MADYARPAPGEMCDRAVVTVTFLRMDHLPARPLRALPDSVMLRATRLDVQDYRDIYTKIGTPWLWWLRRVMPDAALARHLASAAVATHVLYAGDEIAGFFETESSSWPDVNLNYFGLAPEFIGRGLGTALLDAAISSTFHGSIGLRGFTVNTCTADHPRALPNYIAAGFREMRRVKEVWDIPRRLGLVLPEHVRG